MDMNYDTARANMVEQQVRPWEVLDPEVLEVLGSVQREDFVPTRYRKLAFADINLPLPCGEVMMRPIQEGRMLQALAPQPDDRVLEIGTGSGFMAACLAKLTGDVASVEWHEELAREAQNKLRKLGIGSVNIETGDALGDWKPDGQFDVIAVTGAVTEIPQRLYDWLRVDGRLFCVAGEPPMREALLVTRVTEDQVVTESLFDTDLPPLHNDPVHRELVL